MRTGVVRQSLGCPFLALLAVLHPMVFAAAIARSVEPKWVPKTSMRDGTEIQAIEVFREKVQIADKNVKTHLLVDLRFAAKWKVRADSCLFSLTELSLVDDTGKILSSKERLARVLFLNRERRLHGLQSVRGEEGPEIRVIVDSPSEKATALTLKGKATVRRFELKLLQFDLAKTAGKPLDDPLLEKAKIEPLVETSKFEGRESTTVTLRSSSDYERIVAWGLASKGKDIKPAVTGHSGGGPFQSFDRLPKECTLWLGIATPVETKSFQFEFLIVKLPARK